MAEPTTVTSGLSDVVREVLTAQLPYGGSQEPVTDDGYYVVCDYRPIPKATVLVLGRPGTAGVRVYGFVPQGTPAERAELQALLESHLTCDGTLDTQAFDAARLRVFTEAEGVQRLLEVQQLIGMQRASKDRQRFH